MKAGKSLAPEMDAGSIALDGERELSFTSSDDVSITLMSNAFRTVNVSAVMHYCARHGLLRENKRSFKH